MESFSNETNQLIQCNRVSALTEKTCIRTSAREPRMPVTPTSQPKKEKKKNWCIPGVPSIIKHVGFSSLNFLFQTKESSREHEGATISTACVAVSVYTRINGASWSDSVVSSACEPSSAVQHPVRMRRSKWHPHLHCISSARILASQPDCRLHCISNRMMRRRRSLLEPSTRSLVVCHSTCPCHRCAPHRAR